VSQKGEPGLCGFANEIERVNSLLMSLECAISNKNRIRMPDGQNHHILLDGYSALDMADVLKKYRRLLIEQGKDSDSQGIRDVCCEHEVIQGLQQIHVIR